MVCLRQGFTRSTHRFDEVGNGRDLLLKLPARIENRPRLPAFGEVRGIHTFLLQVKRVAAVCVGQAHPRVWIRVHVVLHVIHRIEERNANIRLNRADNWRNNHTIIRRGNIWCWVWVGEINQIHV